MHGPYGFRLKYRLTRHRLREYRKAEQITTPAALLNQSAVTMKLTTSPEPLIANNTKANHQAHFLRWSRPTAAAHVPAPSSSSSMPEILPKARKAAAPGLLSCHNRSKSVLGKSREAPTTAAIAVAANRKAATIGTAFGLCSMAHAHWQYSAGRRGVVGRGSARLVWNNMACSNSSQCCHCVWFALPARRCRRQRNDNWPAKSTKR